ncbi:MAG: response regulator [Acidobacteria bacterium]|nr:response regulator [Acidobacteriota bacterium]
MSLRVLVVEDDQDLCGLIARYLTKLGYETETAFDARGGLSAVESSALPFDLFIVDLSLPDTSGAELATRILAIQPSAQILLTSGYPMEKDSLASARQVDFLLKPFPPQQLAGQLKQMAERAGAR